MGKRESKRARAAGREDEEEVDDDVIGFGRLIEGKQQLSCPV